MQILLCHCKLDYTLEKVIVRSGKLAIVSDYLLHPVGSAPLLQLDGRECLIERGVILV